MEKMVNKFENFKFYSENYEIVKKQYESIIDDFLINILKNEITKQNGDLIEERIRIKAEYAFTGDINIMVVDKVIYDEEKGILVYGEDGELFEWDELYFDDKVLIANTISTRFKEDFLM